jgi:hypothetical protein
MELIFGLDISDNMEDWKRTGEFDEGSFGIINVCYTAIFITQDATSVHVPQEHLNLSEKQRQQLSKGIPSSPLGPYLIMFMLRPLYPWRKRPCYPLEMRLDGTQSHSGRCAEEKSLPNLRVQPLVV